MTLIEQAIKAEIVATQEEAEELKRLSERK